MSLKLLILDFLQIQLILQGLLMMSQGKLVFKVLFGKFVIALSLLLESLIHFSHLIVVVFHLQLELLNSYCSVLLICPY
jgi:hypothetical protein